MSKVAVVYWSATGNTETMANAVAAGAGGADLFPASIFDLSILGMYDAVAFGCPAMGCEELEDSEFEPMFAGLEGSLKGKKIGLFGSYGWGDGQWMRDWETRALGDGAFLAADCVVANYEPDDSVLDECKALGAALAA